MIIALVASFLIALLSGLGIGGGGLFVVFLNFFTDLPQLTIQGINLLFFLFSSGGAMCIHLGKRQIFGSAVITMALFGILGASLGMMLAGAVAEGILRKIFGGMLVSTGIITLQRGAKGKI
jgi:uncharacterized membrane protein YfcA